MRNDTPHPARITPYELVFGAPDFEARIFPRIGDEADVSGSDPLHRSRFAFLTSATELARSLVPEEAPAEALEQHEALLYHAYNFWRYGKRVYLLEAPVARYLVEAAPSPGEWELVLPHPSVYLQLPPNLFWASVSPESTPEPVDGFFVTSAEGDDPLGEPYREVQVMAVLGIRRDRAGFSVIPFVTEAGPGIAAAWAEASVREGGDAFRSVLPGGEISGLYSLLTTDEALKLLARALWYVDAHPDALALETPPERRGAEEQGALPLPRIPYVRVSLGSEG